jgi:predicted nucleic acid-binding protein
VKALYVETSVLGQAYLHEVPEAHAALHTARRGRRLYTSALTAVELRCAIAAFVARGRLRAENATELLRRLTEVLSRMDVVPLGDAVLARAGEPFVVAGLRALDALHLATAVQISNRREVTELLLLSRDDRIRENAVALGMRSRPQARSPGRLRVAGRGREGRRTVPGWALPRGAPGHPHRRGAPVRGHLLALGAGQRSPNCLRRSLARRLVVCLQDSLQDR